MTTQTASAQDFATWAADAATKTVDQLHHIIADCRSAEVAMQGWNPVREGFYSDQAATYSDELRLNRTKF